MCLWLKYSYRILCILSDNFASWYLVNNKWYFTWLWALSFCNLDILLLWSVGTFSKSFRDTSIFSRFHLEVFLAPNLLICTPSTSLLSVSVVPIIFVAAGSILVEDFTLLGFFSLAKSLLLSGFFSNTTLVDLAVKEIYIIMLLQKGAHKIIPLYKYFHMYLTQFLNMGQICHCCLYHCCLSNQLL